MNGYKIACRYAEALYDLSPSKEQMKMDLSLVVDLINSNIELNHLLFAPQISNFEKKALLKKIVSPLENLLLMNFLFQLLHKERLKLVPEIFTTFKRLMAKESDILEMQVISAIPLSSEIRQQLKEKLETSYQKKVFFEESVDAKILGGFILIIGDQLLDYSVRQRLEKLKTSLLRGV